MAAEDAVSIAALKGFGGDFRAAAGADVGADGLRLVRAHRFFFRQPFGVSAHRTLSNVVTREGKDRNEKQREPLRCFRDDLHCVALAHRART